MLLELVVFTSGALVMIYEIAGSRILAPYVGTSVIIWTSLIGIILGALSIGYYLGGRIADRRPRPDGLAFLLLVAALLIGITTISKEFVLQMIMASQSDIKTAAVIAAVVLFGPASIILGTVSPFAVRLKLSAVNTAGATVGTLYALSTVGSIVGTFLAGFYLVPAFGVTSILFLLSLTLVGLSLLLAANHFVATKIAFALLFAAALPLADPLVGLSPFYADAKDINTVFNRVLIRDGSRNDRPVREMMISNEHSSAMYLDGDELVYDYTKFYHLARHFFPNFSSGLVLGGAGYSFPKSYLQTYPNATLDVVEIDPGLTEIAREYFRLEDDPRLTIHHEDARTFLNRSEKKIDVIFGDAFNSHYSIPFHLTTKEAVERMYDMLSEDGIVILNIISAIEGDQGKFLRAEYATYQAVFPHVLLFPVRAPNAPERVQNIILVASKSSQLPSSGSADAEIDAMLQHYRNPDFELDMPVLTDDYAPVDFYISHIIREL